MVRASSLRKSTYSVSVSPSLGRTPILIGSGSSPSTSWTSYPWLWTLNKPLEIISMASSALKWGFIFLPVSL